jgi:hypothetical protein
MDWLTEAQLDNLVYWAGRQAETQQKLTEQGIKAADAQMRKQYARAMQSVVEQFVATYEHLLARAADGNVTPADLYKLDKYWQMQAQLQQKDQMIAQQQGEIENRARYEQHLIKQFQDKLKGVTAK